MSNDRRLLSVTIMSRLPLTCATARAVECDDAAPAPSSAPDAFSNDGATALAVERDAAPAPSSAPDAFSYGTTVRAVERDSAPAPASAPAAFFDGATARALERDAAPALASAPDTFSYGVKDRSVTINRMIARRMALAYRYLYVDNAPLPEDWDIGKDGYVETLHVRLNVPIGSKSRMKSDLLVIAACHANGE